MTIHAEILKNVSTPTGFSIHVCLCLRQWRRASFGPQTKDFFRNLGLGLRSATSDENSHQHLIQKISIPVQHWNTASMMWSLPFVFRGGGGGIRRLIFSSRTFCVVIFLNDRRRKRKKLLKAE